MFKRTICILYIISIMSLCGCSRIEDVTEQIDSMIDNNGLFTATFNENLSQGDTNVKLDLSSVEQGYIAISANSDKRLKLQVTKDEDVYTYDVDSSGIPSIFPLQCGNGTYSFRLLENVEESSYASIYFTETDVNLIDEFQPYIRPNDYVNYTESSACIQKANELAQGAENETDIIIKVFN
ncbi:MAG: hypothetical protein NC548_45780 [Lachnospiraceae bacterium]|nr:hypothetical protein [Lachnospiraceae bacterium]